jgi:putative phosphoribosyl transferase
MTFKDRLEAGSALAARLKKFSRPLVLAIPRGAVPMAEVIARELGGDLDVILVHKFGFPDNPEFALGSVSESGDIHLGIGAERYGLGLSSVSAWASSEIAALRRKREFFTPHADPLPFTDRDVIIVDDGIATGATATAAVRTVQSGRARSITIATPVASNEAVLRLQAEGAAVEALLVPERFQSVGAFFEDFSQVTDEEVIEILRGRPRDVEILLGRSAREAVSLRAFLTVPARAMGLVIFAHGSGSGRLSSRNQYVASVLNRAGIATLLADLLTEEEAENRRNVFDIAL